MAIISKQVALVAVMRVGVMVGTDVLASSSVLRSDSRKSPGQLSSRPIRRFFFFFFFDGGGGIR